MNSPIFILCYSRSGSTLLRYIFDTHTDICSPSEMHLANLCIQLTRAYEKTIPKTENTFEAAIKLCHKNISEIMGNYCERHRASVWCEKSISTIDQIDWIKKVFPNARYVALHRQCLDVVHSSLEALDKYGPQAAQGFGWEQNMTKHRGNNIAAMADYWEEKTTRLLEFEAIHPSQCVHVKYEDIVQNSRSTLENLFCSIGENWQDELINKVFSASHDLGPGDDKIQQQRSIHSESINTGHLIDTSKIPSDLLKRINKTNNKLHYPEL